MGHLGEKGKRAAKTAAWPTMLVAVTMAWVDATGDAGEASRAARQAEIAAELAGVTARLEERQTYEALQEAIQDLGRRDDACWSYAELLDERMDYVVRRTPGYKRAERTASREHAPWIRDRPELPRLSAPPSLDELREDPGQASGE